MSILLNQEELIVLSTRAKEYFEQLGDDRIAIAAKGTKADLVLIHAAAMHFGSGNVFVITADTGFLHDEPVNLIVKACEIDNLDYTAITVYVEDDEAILREITNAKDLRTFDVTHTTAYKHCIFQDMLHEAWLRGYSVLADGCTDDNYRTKGNNAQHDLCVVSPLVSDVE